MVCDIPVDRKNNNKKSPLHAWTAVGQTAQLQPGFSSIWMMQMDEALDFETDHSEVCT